MKWKLVALTAAVACVLPLAGCATGPAAGPQGDMTDSGFATGTLCIDGQKFAAADSSGGCNTWCFLVLLSWFCRLACGVEEFEDFLAWFHVAEGLAWPVVEFLGDRVEVGLGVFG